MANSPSTDALISLPPAPQPLEIKPVADQDRFIFLDVLRGIVLLGILPENMPIFGLPSITSAAPYAVTASGWHEPLVYYLTRFFGDYKFITIFALLFGVGLALIHQRCERSGRNFYAVYARRSFALLAIGLLHAWFIWDGDVLVYYAVGGFIAMWMVNWQARTLRRVGVTLILIPPILLAALGSAAAFKDSFPAEVQDLIVEFEEPDPADRRPPSDITQQPLEKQLEYFEQPDVQTHIFRHGTYFEIMMLRFILWVVGAAVIMLYMEWRILGLFLIGMALLKDGWFLRPAENPSRFRRLAIVGLLVGLPLQIAAVVTHIRAHSTTAPDVSTDAFSECLQYLGSLGMSALYIFIVAAIFTKFGNARPLSALAAVGKMALTNYILQSVLATLVFYSYGLRLYGTLDRLQMWLVILAIWSLNLAFSVFWTRRFEYGPLEWLWRKLTYGVRLNFKRRPANIPA